MLLQKLSAEIHKREARLITFRVDVVKATPLKEYVAQFQFLAPEILHPRSIAVVCFLHTLSGLVGPDGISGSTRSLH